MNHIINIFSFYMQDNVQKRAPRRKGRVVNRRRRTNKVRIIRIITLHP